MDPAAANDEQEPTARPYEGYLDDNLVDANNGTMGKSRKRLRKGRGGEGGDEAAPAGDDGLDDWKEEAAAAPAVKKRKGSSKKEKKEKRGRGGSEGSQDDQVIKEMEELWQALMEAEDEVKEGEKDDEIEQLFKGGKRRRKNDTPPADIGLVIERYISEWEVAAEEDANLNRDSRPAITKLKKLPMLIDVLSKKILQQDFLDHGVLPVLKTWLEPLPDGSLPNMDIRSALLKLLIDFPIDLEQCERREQLKQSGLGKVIMFLSKSDEETTANRKLARQLVDKWSRPIFNKSTRYEDLRTFDDERYPYMQPKTKKPLSSSFGMEFKDQDLDDFTRCKRTEQKADRAGGRACRPEALSLDFVIRPPSKIDAELIKARAKQLGQNQGRLRMCKKLQQLKRQKKGSLQATKLNVDGRNMIKLL